MKSNKLIVERPSRSGVNSLYIIAILHGLGVTFRHTIRNLFFPEKILTTLYPEQKKTLPPTTRGRHRLMKREDGLPRCTACMLCAANCPAECIHILAGESADPTIEKYPEKFDIDLLRCVFCGYCVEACPLDAIRMDIPDVMIAEYTRDSFIYNKERLLDHDNKDIVPNYNPQRPVKWTHGPHAHP